MPHSAYLFAYTSACFFNNRHSFTPPQAIYSYAAIAKTFLRTNYHYRNKLSPSFRSPIATPYFRVGFKKQQ